MMSPTVLVSMQRGRFEGPPGQIHAVLAGACQECSATCWLFLLRETQLI